MNSKFLPFAATALLLAISSLPSHAVDSTSLTADDNVSPQSISGGGVMTGPELFEATKGRTAKANATAVFSGVYTVGKDGYLLAPTTPGKPNSKVCLITSGQCSYGFYSGGGYGTTVKSVVNLTQAGMQVNQSAGGFPSYPGYMPAQNILIPWQ